jgi:hypothetical protein
MRATGGDLGFARRWGSWCEDAAEDDVVVVVDDDAGARPKSGSGPKSGKFKDAGWSGSKPWPAAPSRGSSDAGASENAPKIPSELLFRCPLLRGWGCWTLSSSSSPAPRRICETLQLLLRERFRSLARCWDCADPGGGWWWWWCRLDGDCEKTLSASSSCRPGRE